MNGHEPQPSNCCAAPPCDNARSAFRMLDRVEDELREARAERDELRDKLEEARALAEQARTTGTPS